MTSYLLISSDKEALEKKYRELCAEKAVDIFDITIFDITSFETKTPKRSWGIDDVKQIQKKMFLKPGRGQWKALVLLDADLLTVEAQNAMLKILEEPPAHTLFILTAASDQKFLPTIISRCFVISLSNTKQVPNERKEAILSELESLQESSVGERLKKAEVLSKDKEEAISWLKTAIIALHEKFTDSEEKPYRELQLLQRFYTTITTTNTNLRLSLENLFLLLK